MITTTNNKRKRSFIDVFTDCTADHEQQPITTLLKTNAVKRLYILNQYPQQTNDNDDNEEETGGENVISPIVPPESLSPVLIPSASPPFSSVSSLLSSSPTPPLLYSSSPLLILSDENALDEEGNCCLIDLHLLRHLSNEFPLFADSHHHENDDNEQLLQIKQQDASHEMFLGSEFQMALIEHVEKHRIKHNQQMGLIVLCTGLGKTIFSILLVQRQLSLYSDAKLRRITRTREGMRIRTNEESDDESENEGVNANGCIRDELTIWANEKRKTNKTIDSGTNKNGNDPLSLLWKRKPQKSKKPLLIIKRRRNQEPIPNQEKSHEARDRPLFRYLFLVHSKLIRDGAFHKFKRHFVAYGFKESSFFIVDQQTETLTISQLENRQFIFCLFQSFDKLPNEFVRTMISHVCIDEVHHLVATTYRQVFETLTSSLYKHGQNNGCETGIRFILGMTATLHHRDDPKGDTLRNMFNETVYIDLPWTMAKELNYFPPVSYIECVTQNLEHDFETYDSMLTQLNEKKIGTLEFVTRLERSCKRMGFHKEEHINKRTSANYVSEIYHSFCMASAGAGLPDKPKTIIFAASCSVADELEKLLLLKGYSAASIHYNTKKKRMEDVLDKFHAGHIKIVINVMMMNEGFDVKDIGCVVLARPTESELVFVQQMGRGLRKTNGNQGVTVLDTCFNLRRRWKRLLQEVDQDHLRDLILAFWRVDSFVGMPHE